MTMHKQRSFFVTGVLLSALVLFGAAPVFAEPEPAMDVDVTRERYTSVTVTWEYTPDAASPVDAKEFVLRYQETTCTTTMQSAENVNMCTFGVTSTSKAIKSMKVRLNTDDDDEDYEAEITGLTPGKTYLVGVTTVAKEADVPPSAEMKGRGTTDSADEPDDIDDLDLEAGDGVILATWDAATDNGSAVTGYEVQYMMEDEDNWTVSRAGSTKDTSTMWAISNLENGMEYSVRVRAYSYTATSDDIWSDLEMATPMAGGGTPTPTPALPLFGAFALGAGVLAAGRARLRRREQRQLTR